jgi:hypothetical protein
MKNLIEKRMLNTARNHLRELDRFLKIHRIFAFKILRNILIFIAGFAAISWLVTISTVGAKVTYTLQHGAAFTWKNVNVDTLKRH